MPYFKNQSGLAPILIIIIIAVIGIGALIFNSKQKPQSTDNQISNLPSVSPSSSPTPKSSTKSNQASPSPSSKSSASPSVSPSPSPKPPTCTQTTIAPQKGDAPISVSLHGSGSAGSAGLIGYQWDFEGDGTWDSGVQLNSINYTYEKPGTYTPKYRILDKDDRWSETCTYPFKVEVATPPSTVTATFTCVQPHDSYTSNHVDLAVDWSVYNPDKGGAWTTITDESTQEMIYVQAQSDGLIVTTNSFSAHDLMANIRGTNTMTFVGDGREYSVKVYLAPYTTGTPNLGNPVALTKVSKICN